jgi:hypothetical protein
VNYLSTYNSYVSTVDSTMQIKHCTSISCLHVRRLRLKCDGTRAETRFRLSAKRTSPFKSPGASVRSTTGSQGVRICGSNAEYTMFRCSVKGTDYPLHSSVSPLLPLPCVTMCHHVSAGLYQRVPNRATHLNTQIIRVT